MEENIQKIKQAFDNFYNKNKRYPTSIEIGDDKSFPFSTRYIQRNFGGLVAFRKMLNINQEYSHGENLKISRKKNEEFKKICFDFLTPKFGERNVHRNFYLFDNQRFTVDFRIYSGEGKEGFVVDVFSANCTRSVIGYLNMKIKRYSSAKIDIPVYFVLMNDNITQDQIDYALANKKNKLPENYKCVTYEQFKSMV